MDDREDVWANADNNATGRPGEPPENLLLVKPYHWKPFKGYADVNNSSGNDLSKSDDGPNLIHPTINDEEDDMQLVSDDKFLTFKRCAYSFFVPLFVNYNLALDS